MSARTQVGIVEWARRIDRALRAERRLAGALSARVGAEPDVGVKIDLVRGARLHAWHADLWKSVTPVLHNFSPDEVADPASDADVSAESVREQLDEDYRAWASEASPVAEAPVLRVLRLIARDHDEFATG